MGDIAEDMTEALRVIDKHVDACAASVSERFRFYYGRSEQGDVDDAEADVKTTRKEMEDTLRALIDPRACA